MSEKVMLSHGSGGRQAHDLIEKIFTLSFGMTTPHTDSAILDVSSSVMAFTTDSYVIDPLFFPGGDIGKMSVCGTVNDLAVSGAEPKYIAASFIIEEGFPVDELGKIAESMAAEAAWADVKIVTGDTKVVEKGKCDRLFVTTAGTGFIKPEFRHISTGRMIMPGDKIIINGPLGNHSIAILGARKSLNFKSPVISDCASLNHLIGKVMSSSADVHFMRDITRGGLAAVLNEILSFVRTGIVIDEETIPVDEPVRGICEILGFDPLFLANEGKVLIVAGEKDCREILEILKSDPLGRDSSVIGEFVEGVGKKAILKTVTGGRRIIDMPSGLMLPRIC